MIRKAIDITDADDICCKECSGVYFKQLIRIKKISALLSPTGQDIVVPVQVVQCDRCGKIDESVLAGGN
tara:strand:- start:1955 stop:2161 length:207 start_codon:yes stop_codon:yes gene_type:complete